MFRRASIPAARVGDRRPTPGRTLDQAKHSVPRAAGAIDGCEREHRPVERGQGQLGRPPGVHRNQRIAGDPERPRHQRLPVREHQDPVPGPRIPVREGAGPLRVGAQRSVGREQPDAPPGVKGAGGPKEQDPASSREGAVRVTGGRQGGRQGCVRDRRRLASDEHEHHGNERTRDVHPRDDRVRRPEVPGCPPHGLPVSSET